MKGKKMKIAPIFTIIVLFFTISLFQLQADEPLMERDTQENLMPAPSLTPKQVVRIQLEALRDNDEDDRGIAVAFRFASPANKQSTGPIERFTAMLKGPLYSPMLGFIEADYEKPEVRGTSARLKVKLYGSGGQVIVYVFYLSKQTEDPYSDCWMTDAVTIESWEQQGMNI
jgi:hypothetical protein